MTLSFNISVSDRDFIKNSDQPFQIMPTRNGWLTDRQIASYSEGLNKQILIHTSYVTRVFSPTLLYSADTKKKLENLLNQYIKLAHKLHTPYILVHGPYSTKECNKFDEGLKMLQELTKNNPDIKFVIEIPSFTKELLTHLKDKTLNFIDEYIGKIVKNGFEIVIDTAHTFNNTLSNEEVLMLVKVYSKSISWIHFNGNLCPPISKDKHCPMYVRENLIKDPIRFTQELLKLTKCVFISETVENNYNEWKKFCDKTGLKIISKDVFDHV